MFWRLSLSIIVAGLLSFSGIMAQSVTYPEPVRKVFEKADAEVTEYEILRFAQNDRSALNDTYIGRPRIAVPDCE